jgi:hypothetical protein
MRNAKAIVKTQELQRVRAVGLTLVLLTVVVLITSISGAAVAV